MPRSSRARSRRSSAARPGRWTSVTLVLRRGVPGPAAARRRRRGGGRALAGPASCRTWLRNGRRRRPGVVRHRGTVPGRGSAGRRLARRDRRGHRTGPERRGRGVDARREIRRAGDRRSLRRQCRYVGAVGSRKTQADRRARLREAGVSEDELAELRGPIGLDLGGRNPSETALAILAEIVAERYGGSGRPMRDIAAEHAIAAKHGIAADHVRETREPTPITGG